MFVLKSMFDLMLAEDQVPLDRRALRAAMVFTEELVNDVSGLRVFAAFHRLTFSS